MNIGSFYEDIYVQRWARLGVELIAEMLTFLGTITDSCSFKVVPPEGLG